MEEPTPLTAGGSRRRPPREPAEDAVPIPEVARARSGRGVRIQDVLAAHQRAVDARLEEGLRELRLSLTETLRRALQRQSMTTPAHPAGTGVGEDDVVRGVVAHTEERMQGITMRLGRLEDSLRALAVRQPQAAPPVDDEKLREVSTRLEALEMTLRSVAEAGADTAMRETTSQEVRTKLDALARGLARMAAMQQKSFERMNSLHTEALDRIAEEQRAGLEELARQTGLGVKAMAGKVEREIGEVIRAMADHVARWLGPQAVADGEDATPEEMARVRVVQAPRIDTEALERLILAIAERQESLLERHLETLRASVNSLHRTVAWEGMTVPRPQQPSS